MEKVPREASLLWLQVEAMKRVAALECGSISGPDLTTSVPHHVPSGREQPVE